MRLLADDFIDFLLRTDVHAAHRIVHQHHRGSGRERPREEHLLLVAARKRENTIGEVLRPDVDTALPVSGPLHLGRHVHHPSICEVAERTDRKILQNAPEFKDAVEASVAGHEGNGGLAARQPVAGFGRMKFHQHPRLTVAGKPGKPDDLAALRTKGQTGTDLLHDDRGTRKIPHCPAICLSFRDAAHGFDQAVLGPIDRTSVGDDASILHDHDPARSRQDLVEDVRNEYDGSACVDEAADIAKHLLRKTGIERRGGLVKDDEPRRHARIGEGHGDFDHLALGDRKFADASVAFDSMSGKDQVEASLYDLPRPLPPAETTEVAVQDAGVFDDGEIGAKRQFLEDAAHAARPGDADAVAR